jgi:hypothetical protein
MKTKRHQQKNPYKTSTEHIHTRHQHKTSIQGSQKIKTIQDLKTKHQNNTTKQHIKTTQPYKTSTKESIQDINTRLSETNKETQPKRE